MKDKVSVIIPCYNVEKYIMRCIHSIERQTYGYENIELILIDDASSDSTPDIIRGYSKMHSENVIPLCLKHNRRQGAARNYGLELASGKYITFIDSDDFVADTMIEKLVEAVIENECEMASCGYLNFSDENDVHPQNLGGSVKMNLQDEQTRKDFILRSMICFPVGKMFLRSFLIDNNIRFLEGILYEDEHYSLICACLLNTYYYLDEKLYFYYQNPSSTMHLKFDADRNMQKIEVMDRFYEELKARGIYDYIIEKFGYEIEAYYLWMGYFSPMEALWNEFNYQVGRYKEKMLERYPNILQSPYATNITYEKYLKFLEFVRE